MAPDYENMRIRCAAKHALFPDTCSCGSLTHKVKDCLERPRPKGAKFTNKNIAADDLIQDVQSATFDAKRDRWNGYDAKEYSTVRWGGPALELKGESKLGWGEQSVW